MLKSLVCFAVLLGFTGRLDSQSAVDIQKAIALGQSQKFDALIADCNAGTSFSQQLASSGPIRATGRHKIIVARTEGRVAFLAAEAKRRYETFSLEALKPEDVAPAAFVWAVPNEPSSGSGGYQMVAGPIEIIVVKGGVDGEIVLKAEELKLTPVEWSNLSGGKYVSNSALARFNLDAFRQLPAGDISVVLVGPTGERKCKIGTKDRVRVFGS